MYVFRGGGVLHTENGETCAEILMNGYWEELIGKGEELFDARQQLRAHPTHHSIHFIHYSASTAFLGCT